MNQRKAEPAAAQGAAWLPAPLSLLFAALLGALATSPVEAAREAVLRQVQLPHGYYWRELYLPQLTSGPSAADFTPDGKSVVYSMAGSLWRQALGADRATELTSGPGYDFQPDVSPDGSRVVFARQHRDAIELVELDLASGTERALTRDRAVAIEPRYSPDGSRIAYVSTRENGRFTIFVAASDAKGLLEPRRLFAENRSTLSRYYYSEYDHAINPGWSADGKRLFFVSNRDSAWGSGDIWSAPLDDPGDWQRVLREETTWSARPEISPDGKRLLYSSYQGRQWHQLWLATPGGDYPLPLTFGEFDRRNARWSPDGERVLYISNEGGNTSLWVQEVVGGERREIVARTREWRRPMATLNIAPKNADGEPIGARISVLGADGRHYAPAGAWMRGDDGFDRERQEHETHYFECAARCSLEVPEGRLQVRATAGFLRRQIEQRVDVAEEGATLALGFADNSLPAEYGPWISLDQHVHMNYGGHYRNTVETLAHSAAAEHLDVLYNLIVNKEQRVNDIAEFRPGAQQLGPVTVIQSQEFHTSYWGHLALLHLDDHVLTPDFSAYRHTALASPWPHNGVVSELARRQNALVAYVHPFDWAPDPAKDKSLSNALPADVALGNIDYLEVVSFADHRATASVWHRLLNLGYRLPAGAGTDAMANYASLRGPVGLNRLFLNQSERTPEALAKGIRSGRGFVSNGPLLGFSVAGKRPGEVLKAGAGERVAYRASVRSAVPIEQIEVLLNNRPVATLKPGRQGGGDYTGELALQESGWVLLRAWGPPTPALMDIYPYATTNPVWIEIEGAPQRAPADAAYFVAWLDRVIADVLAREDFNTGREKESTLAYLREARARYEEAM